MSEKHSDTSSVIEYDWNVTAFVILENLGLLPFRYDFGYTKILWGRLMEWNNKELRLLVSSRCASDSYEKFELSMSSVQWKLNMAYRSREKCLLALKHYEGYSQLELSEKAMKCLWGKASNLESNVINKMLLDVELYCTSYVQAMHSIPDVISNVAFIALEIGGYGYSSCLVNLWNIKKILEKKNIFPSLLKAIIELEESREWKYLSALTNMTKHQQIIEFNFSVKINDLDNGIFDASLKGFKKGKYFAPESLNAFLADSYEILGQRYLKIGQAINEEANAKLFLSI